MIQLYFSITYYIILCSIYYTHVLSLMYYRVYSVSLMLLLTAACEIHHSNNSGSFIKEDIRKMPSKDFATT